MCAKPLMVNYVQRTTNSYGLGSQGALPAFEAKFTIELSLIVFDSGAQQKAPDFVLAIVNRLWSMKDISSSMLMDI